MSETCQKLAFTHPIVVLKSGLKNNWMKKLDRVNRPSYSNLTAFLKLLQYYVTNGGMVYVFVLQVIAKSVADLGGGQGG